MDMDIYLCNTVMSFTDIEYLGWFQHLRTNSCMKTITMRRLEEISSKSTES